jgi:hypothetical protein
VVTMRYCVRRRGCSGRHETANVCWRSLKVFKDLHGQTVLKRDGGHVGSVLSPEKVAFMKPGKLRKKKRAGLLLLCITVL